MSIFLQTLLLLTILIAPSSVPTRFTALWDSDHSATIQWTQTTRTCLSVRHSSGETAFIGCYERFPATIIVTLGHVGPLSGNVRPTVGDVYQLQSPAGIVNAPLRRRNIYFPIMRR